VTDIAHSDRKASLERLRELRRELRKLRIACRGRADLLARLEVLAKRLIRSLIRRAPNDTRPITLPESPAKFAVEEATGPPRLASDKRQRRSVTGAPKSAPKGNVVSSDKPTLPHSSAAAQQRRDYTRTSPIKKGPAATTTGPNYSPAKQRPDLLKRKTSLNPTIPKAIRFQLRQEGFPIDVLTRRC
jgi:hypothetical protein